MKTYILFFLLPFLNINAYCQEATQKKWQGEYSLSFSLDRKYAPPIYWQHSLKIGNNKCNYEGSGFQFYSKYECYTKENKDTLSVFAIKNLDGYDLYNKDQLIMKLYIKNNTYYTKTKSLKPEEAENKMTKLGYIVHRK